MDYILDYDQFARTWVVSHRLPVFDLPMWILSAIGRGGLVWLVLAVVLAVWKRRPRILMSMALAVVLATALTDHLIKPLVARERPFLRTPAVLVIGSRPDDASFPSGHAANAFAGAAVLSAIGAAFWWAWALAVAIAYSRVYVGVHYPLDVCGGALIGVLCGLFVLRLERFVMLLHDSRSAL